MSTQYDLPRPASHLPPMDAARRHMSSKPTSHRPSYMQQHSTHRVPVASTSLPQTSWLSDVGEINPAPPSQIFLGVSAPGSDSLLSSGSLSDSGSPTRSPHRARSREYLPSSSISAKSSGSTSLSRHSPVPPPGRTLHTSRSFSATSPLKTSAFPDRDASGHLDFKRLMSKPAKQSASGSSMVSLPSDSEGLPSSPPSRFLSSRRPSATASAPTSSPSRSAHPSRENLSLHVHTSGFRSNSTPHEKRRPSPERRPTLNDGHGATPARNVLRRRPSSRSNPGTPTAGSFQIPQEDTLPPLRSLPSASQLRSSNVGRSSSARPSTSPSSRAATLPRKIPPSSSKGHHGPAGLTPAGAVALAYKQQEQRREELAETASFNDAYNPSSNKASSLPMHNLDVDVPADESEEGGEPYYTVFGGASGRLVAVGTPADDDWHITGWDTRATVATGHKPNSRSLSRKVSGSFKRVAESIRKDKEPRDPLARARGLEDWRPYDGSRNLGGRDSPSRLKNVPRPLPLDTAVEGRSSPRLSPVAKSSSSPKSSASPQEDGRSSRSSKSRGKDNGSDHSPGGIFSKLMKRISSSGGLREKYSQSDEPPPPVPALPDNIPRMPTSRTTMDITHTDAHGEDVSENGVLLKKFMQSRSSLSGVRPPALPAKPGSSSASPRPSTGTAGRPSTGNTSKSRASLGHRPSTTTRSSSPVSSEMASSGFNHNHTPSTRSSFSSLGEEIPPMPKNVGQYILSPGELSRMTKGPDGAPSTPSKRVRSSRSHSVHVESPARRSSPDDIPVPSLPLPPRRMTHEGCGGSPLSSSFSGEDISLPPGSSHAPLLAEFGIQEPPPRPKRSSRRAPPSHVQLPPRSQSMSAPMPQSPMTPRGPPSVRVDVNVTRRPSTGALSYASTTRQASAHSSASPSSGPSNAASPSSATSQKRSPLMFRELESPRQKLSEREKAAKWEDLLERSARAGGTLHIGDTGLLSEHADAESLLHDSSSDA
ncbi:hypothetical protein BN946_scf184962.g19 [Trametes cinnabarina]|uniref:Uncharacterized protein n=1 Tax=Pycnoporus cinnabarinus TaxID=5643 RepID=A0A060SCW6_PYCCI|nr:hypothetical protein BN946_scf184962.g19 [Trametes cinnabarina]